MHSTKPALLLLVLAIGASCVVATPRPGLLDGVWQELGHAGQTIVNGLVEAAKNGSQIAGDFFGQVKNSTSEYLEQSAEYAQKIADALHKAVAQGLGDFSDAIKDAAASLESGISSLTDNAKRQALQDALKTVLALQNATSDLESTLNNITAQLEEQKQKHAQEIEVSWNQWAEAQLDRVDEQTNGQGNDEAEEVLNEFQARYSEYIHDCLQHLQVHVALYEQSVHETVSGYHNATDELIVQIQLCLESNSGRGTCRRNINKAVRKLQSAPRDLVRLKLKGLGLLAVGLDASGCVGQTLAEHELEKGSVERKLDEIISRNQASGSTEAADASTANDSEESEESEEE
ncbi:uncharacterized protein Dana_GF23117 [Drosophila ananassae]|uniref:Protein TsetseEP domain-containing protein n=1 Tax=Drosophila ananassae TaxID=7217 RepID=B3MV81_DROAN|nr:uncharacterized protein LOC6505763 [Drosophila ananassae]EDV33146.1 uncharacterized protein Dana_GF23117 [Drosophila ananassae]